MARARSVKSSNNSSANIGFEQKLWLAADKLRSNMDAAEYKHVVLGLIFLKYISDSFEEHHAKLLAGEGEYAGGNPEDPDEYRAENIFWVPPAARWSYLQNSAKQPAIGKIVDDAMVAIERDNPRLQSGRECLPCCVLRAEDVRCAAGFEKILERVPGKLGGALKRLN